MLAGDVGAEGAVLGTDISPGMLRRAAVWKDRNGASNVTLLRQTAGQLEVGGVLDGVPFSLSYPVAGPTPD